MRTRQFYLQVVATATLLCAAPGARAALVELNYSRWVGWSDAFVACGTGCSTDRVGVADIWIYDSVVGSTGFSYSATSGSAFAGASGRLVGTEVSTDDSYRLDMISTNSAFAFVSPDANAGAYAAAYSYNWRLELDFLVNSSALYTGSIGLRRVGSEEVFGSGSILDPGQYYYWSFSDPSFVQNRVGTVPGPAGDFRLYAGQSYFGSSTNIYSTRFESVPVPEPATLGLLGLGLAGIGFARRRRTASAQDLDSSR